MLAINWNIALQLRSLCVGMNVFILGAKFISI